MYGVGGRKGVGGEGEWGSAKYSLGSKCRSLDYYGAEIPEYSVQSFFINDTIIIICRHDILQQDHCVQG